MLKCSEFVLSILFPCMFLLLLLPHFSKFQVSPNNKLVAYAEDTKGDEIYSAYVIDAETKTPLEKPLAGVTSNLEWAGDGAWLYITMDATLRPDKVQLFILN